MSVLVGTSAHDQAAAATQSGVTSPRGLSPLLWSRLLRILDGQRGSSPTSQPANPTEQPGSQAREPASQTVSVLDCGGGSGSLAVPLAARGAEVTVVDISIDALATLLRRATESGVSDRVIAVQGDAEALGEILPSAQFDLVLAHGVLENVPNPALAISQIASVLRPGGIASLLVANPVATVIGRLLVGDIAAALEGLRRSTTSAYSIEAATSHCADAGLTIDSIEGIGVFTELVPGIELERPGAVRALTELEEAAAGLSPYRDIASRLHIVARRPVAGSG